jgi:hypothetical protein
VAAKNLPKEGTMSEDRERFGQGKHRNDNEPDVEAHKFKIKAQEEAPDETSKDNDEPDVEAHRFKNR